MEDIVWGCGKCGGGTYLWWEGIGGDTRGWRATWEGGGVKKMGGGGAGGTAIWGGINVKLFWGYKSPRGGDGKGRRTNKAPTIGGRVGWAGLKTEGGNWGTHHTSNKQESWTERKKGERRGQGK